MDEPGCSTAPVSEPPKEVNGQSNDETDEVPMEIVKDDEASPARLVIKGHEDENEETVIMTIEEAQNYILAKVGVYIRDPNANPLLVLKNQISTLQDKIQNKRDEFVKLNKMFDALYRDQVKFLRHIGVMTKLETKTVGVSVDLPWLPDSVPGMIREDLFKNKSESLFLQPGAIGSNTNGKSVPIKRLKTDSAGPIECIDLTDDIDPPEPAAPASTPVTSPSPTPPITTENKNLVASNTSTPASVPVQTLPPSSGVRTNPSQHPAPLPPVPSNQGSESSETPPKPRLKISVDKNGIVLQWDLPPHAKSMKILGFEIYGYQEKSNVPVSSSLWKKIGCVNPMPLPMSCTLTQFVEGYKYHFSIRALGVDCRLGHFSDPASIMFVPETKN